MPDPDDVDKPWWVEKTESYDLADEFVEAASCHHPDPSQTGHTLSCYEEAMSGRDTSCYMHILAHLIDFYDGKGIHSSLRNCGESMRVRISPRARNKKRRNITWPVSKSQCVTRTFGSRR